MNLYSLVPLIFSMFFLIIGFFVLANNKKGIRSEISISFFGFAFFSFWWQFCCFFLLNVNDNKFADIIARLGYSGIVLLPIVISGFLIAFAETSIRDLKKHFIVNSIIGFIFIITIFTTNFFVEGTYEYFFGFYPRLSFLHVLYLFWMSYLLISAHYKLYIYVSKKNDFSVIERRRLNFLLLGSLGYTIGITDFLVSYGVNFYPIGFIFTTIALIIYSYAILNDAFISIKAIYKYTFVKVIYFISIALLFSPVFLFATNKINLQNYILILSCCLLNILIAIFYIKPYLDKKFLNILDKIGLEKKHKYLDELNKLIYENKYNLLRKKDMEKIINKIFEILDLENISLYIYDSNNNDFIKEIGIGNTEFVESIEFLTIDNNLVEYIKDSSNYCFKQDLIKESADKRVIDEMERLKAEIVYPINISVAATYLKHDNLKNKLDKLNAVLLIGQKRNKENFNKKDFIILPEIIGLLAKSIDYSVQLENRLLSEIIQNQKYFITETSKWMEVENLDELAALIGGSIKQHIIDIESIQIFILNEETNDFECKFSDNNSNDETSKISLNSNLIRFIGNNKQLFTRDEIKKEIESKKSYSKEYVSKLYEDLEKLNGEIYQPIYSYSLLGFIILSKKDKNRRHTMSEINRLDFLTYGAAVSIQKLMFNIMAIRDDMKKIFNRRYIDKIGSKKY